MGKHPLFGFQGKDWKLVVGPSVAVLIIFLVVVIVLALTGHLDLLPKVPISLP
ncbi:MAG: hypothetical protein JO138_03205 [Acidobacteriaceae bacterium]|nr:hypothetical protein [Acidobacteriaceae bacterium]